MDETLLEQFRAGEPGATTPLRNQLRTLSARVLNAPQWGLQDSGLRAQLEREAAQGALDSGKNTSVELTEEAMVQAAAAGLRFLRRRDATVGEHPDPLIMARVAMGAASAAQLARVETHTKGCEPCRHHSEASVHALRTAATAQKAPAVQPISPARPLPVSPRPAPKSASRRDASAKPKPRRRMRGEKKAPFPWMPVLALLAVAAGVVWKMQPSDEQRVWARAQMLPDELPPDQRAPLYSGPAKRAISQLRDANCRESGTLLHLESKGNQDPFLPWYEGTAWVCARDGAAALAAFDMVQDRAGAELPWGFHWWHAQALILEGRDAQALEELDALAGSEHGRAADARALAQVVRAGS